jgi:hypothetical protein
MNIQKGISVFAGLGMLGAVIFAAESILYGIFSESLIVSIVDIIANTLLLVGMIGIYFAHADKLGKFGLISGITVIIGFVFHIFMKATSGFVKPILLEYAPQVLEGQVAPSPLGEMIQFSMTLFPLSIVLFGLAILLSKTKQRKFGLLMMLSPFGFLIPFGVFISPLLFGFIFISLAHPIVFKKAHKEEQIVVG